ncbi:MAG: ABC transporter permease subunit [Clostridia bacterium]|nr:ABC transporter permease subunit [Clostridia bacterium]
MLAIYRREIAAYFHTPIGYIFCAVFLALSGAVFSYTTLFSMKADVTSYFTYMLVLLVILVPLLTMKLFSEERKQKTEQLLLTAPVSLYAMVAGKLLAAYTLYAACTLLSFSSFFILYLYADVKTAVLFGNLVAILLLGLTFITIGLFVSALTENQLAAAIGTVAILLVLMMISLLNSIIPVYWIRFVLSSISVFARFQNFTQGVFDIAALFYYLSISAAFYFLTVRVFDKRRWG